MTYRFISFECEPCDTAWVARYEVDTTAGTIYILNDLDGKDEFCPKCGADCDNLDNEVLTTDS